MFCSTIARVHFLFLRNIKWNEQKSNSYILKKDGKYDSIVLFFIFYFLFYFVHTEWEREKWIFPMTSALILITYYVVFHISPLLFYINITWNEQQHFSNKINSGLFICILWRVEEWEDEFTWGFTHVNFTL